MVAIVEMAWLVMSFVFYFLLWRVIVRTARKAEDGTWPAPAKKPPSGKVQTLNIDTISR